MIRGLCGGLVALVLSLLVGLYVGRDHLDKLPMSVRHKLFLVVPEPDGLAEALRKETAPKLSAEQLKALDEDGVVLLRGVMKQRDTMEKLRKRLWPHIQMPFNNHFMNHKSWLYNGASRALLRDGPLGTIIGQVIEQVVGKGQVVTINEAPVWGYETHNQVIGNAWHSDSRSSENVMLSVWMVLTDGEQALQFVRGSGHRAVREEMEQVCAKPVPGGKQGFKAHDQKCLTDYAKIIEKNKSMTEPSLFTPALKAGDAFLFNGNVLHRGMRQKYNRLAISIRATWKPKRIIEGCNFGLPQVFPQDKSSDRDFDCAPWALLPGLPWVSPWLPASGFANGVLKLFERF